MTAAERLAFLERINAVLTRPFGRPSDTFDPMTATAQELEDLGFPPMPDPTTQSELFAFWLTLLTPPFERFPPVFAFYLPDELPDDNVARTGSAPVGTRQQHSRNWSGASISARDGLMLTDAIGSWTVPAVTAPPPDDDYRSSTWIGLDGQRSYLDATLPQIGTAQRVKRDAGSVTHTTKAWVQWWPAFPELIIPSFPVNPGDVMGSWVRVIPPATAGDPMAVRLFLINFGSPPILALHLPRPYAAFEWDVPQVIWPAAATSSLLQPEVAGGTAEWVFERPTHEGSEILYELPGFTEVLFTNCFAIEAEAPRHFFGDPGRLARATGPTLTQMYTIDGNPRRTVTLARTERLGEHAFRMFPPPP